MYICADFLGYEECILVGHDWGGHVAWCYSAVHPERVKWLIQCNIPHPAASEKYMKTSLSQRCKAWLVRVLFCFGCAVRLF